MGVNLLFRVTISILGVELVFPAAATGVIFAIVESFGGFLNFAAPLLITQVEHYGLDAFYYTTLGVACGLCIINFIQWPLAFMRGPKCLLEFDKHRMYAVKGTHPEKCVNESDILLH